MLIGTFVYEFSKIIKQLFWLRWALTVMHMLSPSLAAVGGRYASGGVWASGSGGFFCSEHWLYGA